MSELTPTQQRQVTFYESEITAVLVDGDVYASIRHMSLALDLNARGQQQRIERNDVLSDGLMACTVHTIQGERPMNMLRADLVPMWLVGVDTRRMDDEKKQRIINFQKRAAKVLWEAFQDGRLTTDIDSELEAAAAAGDMAAQLAIHSAAVAKLARQHWQFQQLATAQLTDHETRIEALETAVSSPSRTISEAQAVSLSQAVKVLAMELSKREKKNMYGAIWGEFYRRYDVAKYRMLPASRFDEAMSWLREWLHQIESESF